MHNNERLSSNNKINEEIWDVEANFIDYENIDNDEDILAQNDLKSYDNNDNNDLKVLNTRESMNINDDGNDNVKN